ncbi:MAG TPA: HAD family hydrolase [Thermoplasmata archaeon]|nr:HAD family hydrolase [Thermoplasmata archaeon]
MSSRTVGDRPRGARLVLFDLDDTLVDHTRALRSALAAVRFLDAALRRRTVSDLAELYQRHLTAAHDSIVRGRVSADASRRERFRLIFEACGAPPTARLLERAIATYRSEYRTSRRLVPGADGVLRALHRSCVIGVLSNNRKDEQAEKISEFGLAPHVDFVLTSEELPWAKPDPRVFRAAVERAGTEPVRATMVGDSWSSDVEGALRAGLAAVWLNRFGETAAPDRSVTELRSFRPVDAAVRRILRARPRGRGATPY